MQSWLVVCWIAGLASGARTDEFGASARSNHGLPGERATQFLAEHMRASDRETLPSEFLVDNLDLAFRARTDGPWAGRVPQEIFLNDVLPYAVFDEPRDPWRAKLFPLVCELVKGAHTATEAAQALDAKGAQMAPVSAAIDALQAWVNLPANERPADAPFLREPLSRSEAAFALEVLAKDRLARLAAERKEEMENLAITEGDKTLRWLEKTFGETPPDGHSLWISMHGGGNTSARVNDRQWQNQSRLYQPAEGIYLAPRAPTDTWNLWHEAHIDPLFQHLIESYVALRGVNPNKVYLLGYSAGGDGVWQLAPRMADRFAAAAMMAGHPNEASLLGLRNLPFAVFVGGRDAAYNRNQVVAERAAELDSLAKDDPGGYVHMARVYEGLPHWMNGKDAEALPWMAAFERQPWPKKVVWQQDDVVHRRFYWLQIPDSVPIKDRARIVATVQGQEIQLEGDVPTRLCLRLSDRLLDLDETITVKVNGRELFAGTAPRQAQAIVRSLSERADPAAAATAILCLSND